MPRQFGAGEGAPLSWRPSADAVAGKRVVLPWRLFHAMGHSASTELEHDDEPSARATRLQPAVGLTGALRGVGGGHTEGDGT